MSLRDAEISTRFGALDDDAFPDGGASNAHVLRTLAMTTNRLVCQAEPFLVMPWDASSDGAEDADGTFTGFGYTEWTQITAPIIGAKRPGMTALDLRLYASVTNAMTCWLQVATGATGFNPYARAGDNNVVTLDGNGSLTAKSLDNIPCLAGARDRVALYLRGDANGSAGTTATYGSPNSGTVGLVHVDFFECSSATWNVEGGGGATWDDGGHYVTFEDASGRILTQARTIVAVAPATRIYFWPALTLQDARRLFGSTFRIKTLPRWRLASVSLYTRARTV